MPTAPNTEKLPEVNCSLSFTNEAQKPKNVVKKFAFATRIGYQPNNPDKVNQDSFILAPNVQDRPALHLFGVCDGHGQYGRDASTFVKFALQMDLEQRISKEDNKDGIAKSLTDSFKAVHDAFQKNVPKPEHNGTTCCCVILNGHKIISANAGDSRAILVNKYRKITPLTKDNKPDIPEEKRRIIQNGGRVQQIKLNSYQKGTGPVRVWLKDQDIPGLAMSRSLGDYIAHSVGVTHKPVIEHFELSPDDQILIIASDGIWEFMSNSNVANIALAHYEAGAAEAAANAIVRRAT